MEHCMKPHVVFAILTLSTGLLFAQSRPAFGNPTNSLKVEIRLADAGDPVDLVKVELARGDMSFPDTYANARGEASWGNLADGSYTVRVTVPGYVPGEASAELSNGIARQLTLVLQPDSGARGALSIITEDPLVSARLLAAPEKVRKEYENSRKARQRGDCDSAIQHSKKALVLAPDFLFAYLEIGMCQLSLGKLDEAEKSFQSAINQDSKSLYGYIGLSSVEIKRERWNEAAKILGLANKELPDRAEPFYELARLQIDVGRLDRAELAAKTALGKDYTRIPDAPFLLARIYVLQGKKEEALKCLQDIALKNPSNDIGTRARRSIDRLKPDDLKH